MSDQLPDDMGQRISAARAYAHLSEEALADSLGLTVPALQLIEAGLSPMSAEQWFGLLERVEEVTHIPQQAFLVDFATLQVPAAPSARLAGVEQTLTRLVAAQEADHALLLRIAQQVGVPPAS